MEKLLIIPEKIKKNLITKVEKIELNRKIMLIRWKEKAHTISLTIKNSKKYSLNPKFVPSFCKIATMI